MTTIHERIQERGEQREYAQDKLLEDVTEELLFELENRGLTKADLASLLGKSKPFVTRLLNGDHNMTLRTLADVCYVLGVNPQVIINGDAHFAAIENKWSEIQPVVDGVECQISHVRGRCSLVKSNHAAQHQESLRWKSPDDVMITEAEVA